MSNTFTMYFKVNSKDPRGPGLIKSQAILRTSGSEPVITYWDTQRKNAKYQKYANDIGLEEVYLESLDKFVQLFPVYRQLSQKEIIWITLHAKELYNPGNDNV